jgi:hypothetical protein
MNVETRKIESIQELLKLQSEEAISKIEKILKKEKEISDERRFNPVAIDAFNKRIDK